MFVQEIGPQAGRVTGEMSPDGSRGWRVDFDPNDPTKGFHINWWKLEKGVYESGANVIIGGTQDRYLEILSHFPKL